MGLSTEVTSSEHNVAPMCHRNPNGSQQIPVDPSEPQQIAAVPKGLTEQHSAPPLGGRMQPHSPAPQPAGPVLQPLPQSYNLSCNPHRNPATCPATHPTAILLPAPQPVLGPFLQLHGAARPIARPTARPTAPSLLRSTALRHYSQNSPVTFPQTLLQIIFQPSQNLLPTFFQPYNLLPTLYPPPNLPPIL